MGRKTKQDRKSSAAAAAILKKEKQLEKLKKEATELEQEIQRMKFNQFQNVCDSLSQTLNFQDILQGVSLLGEMQKNGMALSELKELLPETPDNPDVSDGPDESEQDTLQTPQTKSKEETNHEKIF